MTCRADFARSVSTRFGEVGVLWTLVRGMARVVRIVLPGARVPGLGQAERRSAPGIDSLCADIQRFLQGASVVFDPAICMLDALPAFQRQVLAIQARVPRGRATTYGRIAHSMGKPGAARAVGQALARNPFPLVIPCHRAVRADGSVGGFQGGGAMKRALLEMEGVAIDASGSVLPESIVTPPA